MRRAEHRSCASLLFSTFVPFKAVLTRTIAASNGSLEFRDRELKLIQSKVNVLRLHCIVIPVAGWKFETVSILTRLSNDLDRSPPRPVPLSLLSLQRDIEDPDISGTHAFAANA